jgi:predicted DCC family thiol-disulfide oxidoreductase YuxK
LSEAGAYAVVYDGTCSVCTRVIAALAKLDRNNELEMLPSQTSGLAERFPWIPPSAYNESIQLIRLADGRTWQGAASIEQILDVIPKGKFVSWMFSIPLVRPLAEKFYRWFAKRRYRFGCNAHCRVTPL